MTAVTELIETLTQTLAALRAERKTIDDRIAALELTHETLTGKPAPDTAGPMPVGPIVRGRITRDREWEAKTLAALHERERPVSVESLARTLRVGHKTAHTRLLRLVKSGKVARTDRGKYQVIK